MQPSTDVAVERIDRDHMKPNTYQRSRLALAFF